MKFRYLKFNLKEPSEILGKAVLKPIIPIRLKFRNSSLRYVALIDLGADFYIFDAPIGEYLGIDITTGKKEEFGGIQNRGKAFAYFHKVTIEIRGWDYQIIAGFSYDIAKRGYGVLGQKGFFENFIVKFNLLKEEVELKPRK